MKQLSILSFFTISICLLLITNACKEDCPDETNCNGITIDYTQLTYSPNPYEIEAPATLPNPNNPRYIPENNPLTVEGVALGRKLFYDPILSADSTLACAGCHNQSAAFTDNGKPVSVGVNKMAGTRNSMPLFNLVYVDDLFWDGAARGLEDQALEPVPNHKEMDLPWEDAICRLMNHEEYRKDFYTAFGIETITKEDVVNAIAQFERTIISGESVYDLSQTPGTGVSLDDKARNGELLFFSEGGDCFHCHNNSQYLFSTNTFANNGLDFTATLDDFEDNGLGKVTGNPEDNGKFRIPTLRNIALTGPYMHDGRFETLEEVLEHYSTGIQASPNIDPIIASKFPNGLNLTEQEKEMILAFLYSLTDTSFVNNPAYSNPFE